MRTPCLILVANAMLSSGCSSLIARSGSDLSTLTTREQVHAQFGDPSSEDVVEGQPVEDYRTRRKISEPVRSVHLGMSVTMTYGVGELFAFPSELFLLGQRTLVGQDLRFQYDSNGVVTSVLLDGKQLSFFAKQDQVKPM